MHYDGALLYKELKKVFDGKNKHLNEGIENEEFWIINPKGLSYGVGVECPKSLVFSAEFSQVSLKTRTVGFVENGMNVFHYLLCLETSNSKAKRKFCDICAEFLSPDNRMSITTDPASWWKEWMELLGNCMKDDKPYSVIGEMMLYEYLLDHSESGVDIKWKGPEAHNHDIVTEKVDYEVKSTLERLGRHVHISSEFQLCDNGKSLYIAFMRFIKPDNNVGVSINDMVERFALFHSEHISVDAIESLLEGMGYEKGAPARDYRYYCLECGLYPVVEGQFPIINRDAMKDPNIMNYVEHLDYVVTLSGDSIKIPEEKLNERQN